MKSAMHELCAFCAPNDVYNLFMKLVGSTLSLYMNHAFGARLGILEEEKQESFL
jgi:hypothetical protein